MPHFKRLSCCLFISGFLLANGFLAQIKGRSVSPTISATNEEQVTATRIQIPCSLLFGRTDHAIFQNGEDLKELIAKYQGKECEAGIPKIDFSNSTLLAVRFTSGRCHEPPDLSYKVFKSEDSKRYRFEIRFAKTRQLCRALVYHEVWLQVPKLSADADVEFDLKQIGASDD